MGDHTDVVEPNRFFRGLLYGGLLTALVVVILGFYFIATGAW